MRRNPQKRLGASERDAEDVKRQSFFRVKPDVNEFIAMLKCIYCSFFFLPSFEVFFFFLVLFVYPFMLAASFWLGGYLFTSRIAVLQCLLTICVLCMVGLAVGHVSCLLCL